MSGNENIATMAEMKRKSLLPTKIIISLEKKSVVNIQMLFWGEGTPNRILF